MFWKVSEELKKWTEASWKVTEKAHNPPGTTHHLAVYVHISRILRGSSLRPSLWDIKIESRPDTDAKITTWRQKYYGEDKMYLYLISVTVAMFVLDFCSDVNIIL